MQSVLFHLNKSVAITCQGRSGIRCEIISYFWAELHRSWQMLHDSISASISLPIPSQDSTSLACYLDFSIFTKISVPCECMKAFLLWVSGAWWFFSPFSRVPFVSSWYLVPVVPVRCNDSLISVILLSLTGALLTTVLVTPYLHSVSSHCIQSASWKACLQLVSVFQACV